MKKGQTWEPKEFARFLLIMETLERAPRYKTVNELCEVLDHEGLGVDKRTVQRILRYFNERFGLKSRKRAEDAGQPNEWAWSRKEGRPTLGAMDPPTALTYELAGRLLEDVIPASILEDLEWDFRRARKVLGQTGPKAKAITAKIRILPRGSGRLPASIDPSVLHNLYDALIHNHKIRVKYRPISSECKTAKDYTLNPLGIVTRLDTLYLVHVADTDRPDRDPDKVMEWPLHRFKDVATLGTPVRTPPDFNLDTHLRKLGFLDNRSTDTLRDAGENFKLKALFNPRTAKYVAERPFGPDQKTTKTRDGRVRIEATVANTRELLTQLHDFGADVEILGPKVLRNYFKGLATQLYAQYTE